MTRSKITLILAAVLFAATTLAPSWAEQAQLHLIFNVNSGEDYYPADAGKTLGAALDRVKPEVIDPAAQWYFVLLEDSTIEALGLPVKGEDEGDEPAAAVMSSVAESAMDMAGTAQADNDSVGDTGWIELEAYEAAVYYWSETGEGETSWQPQEFRIFIRRLASGDVVSAIGPGPEPPNS